MSLSRHFFIIFLKIYANHAFLQKDTNIQPKIYCRFLSVVFIYFAVSDTYILCANICSAHYSQMFLQFILQIPWSLADYAKICMYYNCSIIWISDMIYKDIILNRSVQTSVFFKMLHKVPWQIVCRGTFFHIYIQSDL